MIQQSFKRNNSTTAISEIQSYEYDDAGFVCRVTEKDLAATGQPVYVYEPLP